MATSTNLAILLVDSSQAQQDVIVNEALEDIDAAMTESEAIECTDGSNELAATVDECEEIMRRAARLELIEASPATSTAFDVVLPAIKRLLVVTNNTANDATVVCEGAATGAEEATISAGTSGIVYCDSTQVHQLVGGTAAIDAFTALSDTPANYSGQAGNLVAVKGTEDGLEFVSGGAVTDFVDLLDVPSSYSTGDADRPVVVNGAGDGLEFGDWPVQAIPVACSDESTALTTGAAKVTFRMPFAFTLTAVRASVTTAPTGANIIVDINVTGTGSILSTRITIEATEKSSVDATTQPVISSASLADDAEITIDIDQVGSTVAGAGLKVYLIGQPT